VERCSPCAGQAGPSAWSNEPSFQFKFLLNDIFKLSTEVAAALQTGEPVVALESTVIAHGLPRPLNMKTAMRLEQVVREGGATPATIAVLSGKVCIGLNEDQLAHIAEQAHIRKISIRDLPVAVTEGVDGATTVAATIWIAHRVGIEVFATGGIGGVHRGALQDVSADLPQIAQTPLVIVCSGAKAILDLSATREWLETYGVTVVGYGTQDFPAFYSRNCGLQVDVRCDSPEAIAVLIRAQRKLKIGSALLVTVPVPSEVEIPIDQLSEYVTNAFAEAERAGISGALVTPFLLSAMAKNSEGATLRANIALLENNALVAASIARTLRT